VDGFSGMKEMTGSAGRGKSGAELLPDYACFADAADYAGAGAVINHLGSFSEGRIDNRRNRTYRFRLRFDYASCVVEVKFHLLPPTKN
jgi:hypothetical protein